MRAAKGVKVALHAHVSLGVSFFPIHGLSVRSIVARAGRVDRRRDGAVRDVFSEVLESIHDGDSGGGNV